MARGRKKAKALAANHPGVVRMIEDEEFRAAFHDAVGSARATLSRLQSHKSPSKLLAEDHKLQKEVAEAIDKLHEATGALADVRSTVAKKEKRHRGRKLFAAVTRRDGRVSLPPARGCATRRWTGSSAPRRSSSTRRRPRCRRLGLGSSASTESTVTA